MVKIVPKSKCKTDICGTDEYYYIVRPDLACYMRSSDFNSGSDLEIFSLNPACRDGDHYVGYEDGHFYIIKATHYRRVSNMSSDEGAVVYSLHPDCQGGDHYCSAFGYFYIIFQDREVYRRTSNMNKYEGGEEFPLHPDFRNGLYYFGIKNFLYFVNPDDKCGIQYTECTNLDKTHEAKNLSFHPSVYTFLPGGLAIAKGPSYGKWVCIKTIINASQTLLESTFHVSRKLGCEKEQISSIMDNWKLSSTFLVDPADLISLIVKSQFSFTAEYGGCSTNTEGEDWSEVTKFQELIYISLKPQEKLYIYSYQMGLGEDSVLNCRKVRICDNSDPPTDDPMPPADM